MILFRKSPVKQNNQVKIVAFDENEKIHKAYQLDVSSMRVNTEPYFSFPRSMSLRGAANCYVGDKGRKAQKKNDNFYVFYTNLPL